MASSAASPPAARAASNTLHVDAKVAITRPPSLCMKPAQTPPAASPPSSSTPAPMSLTSREWVVPPRPKPGRKPATDTPPTKRKAQNRAAQRAFRERRAARVGELEEQLKQIEEEHEHEQDILRAAVEKLEKEIEHYQTDLAHWVDRCRRLENELAAVRSTTSGSSSSPSARDKAPSSTDNNATNDTSIGCGNCTLETRCQCIDEAFAAMGGEATEARDANHQEKRPLSPSQRDGGEKRIKIESKENLEIDFTAVYASNTLPERPHLENHSPTSVVADPCGFCSDGTPCICAEVAAEQEEAQTAAANSRSTAAATIPTHPPPRQLDQFTPPPSEGDVSMSVPPVVTAPSGCGASGPGTCAQCRADPNSTLFCKSLAASRAQSQQPANTPSSTGGCCGAQTPGGSCCRSSNTNTENNAVPLPRRNRTTRSQAAAYQTLAQQQSPSTNNMPPKTAGVTLTCADAYTTLSRHPAYERAAGDIGEWMPKLHASEPATNKGMAGVAGRPALEIDAANVMAVLRDFDRRFGKSP
ncbi:uncharacterized protein Z520_10110 [Fonsecaea multimorphosa CBS 102226]|uniref:BZIP domain-containing protein n=1 Tax=Fonsecaea multimorphosa CBS 102226 TaxID=1442371 RepID=A0A0D2JUA8_9EURO|nr:uncharacterized protein Z520_10110 [Fonsecaea multimorphosa CBS 102226]KIX94084.1 hypothetical protein Z520_10110 [Fonsecaea multimorphosa CBS 102226]OAL19437.1 hypothetical protein AYO22_09599 [Fonsecaea multimorphosa]